MADVEELLAIAATAAASEEFTLEAGEVATVVIKGDSNTPKGSVAIRLVHDGDNPTEFCWLNNKQPAVQVNGPGVFDVVRVAQADAVGVDMLTSAE